MKKFILLFLLLFTFYSVHAQADTYILSFEGEVIVGGVYGASEPGLPSELESIFQIGNYASGYFYFDSELTDTDPNPNASTFFGPTDFYFQFGSYVATASGGPYSGAMGANKEYMDMDSYSSGAWNYLTGDNIGEYYLTNLEVEFADLSGTALNDDSLLTSIDIDDWTNAWATMIFQHPTLNSPNVFAKITSATIKPVGSETVPEPTTILLLGSCLPLFFSFRRKIKKS